MRERLSPPLIAAVVSALLAVVLTWPVALHPTRWAVGHPGNDTWNHIWGYWWVGEELAAGRWPIFTDLLAFPRGGTLYFIDTIQAILSWPLQGIGGPVLAFNVVMISQVAFSAFAAWLLAAHLTGDAVAAGAALVIYGAAPHLLGQAYNGISETVCAGWFPLTLWCLLRLLDRPAAGRALALALSAVMCVITSWYFGLFAVIGSIVLVAWRVRHQAWLIEWRRTGLALAGAAALVLAAVAPFFKSFQDSLDHPKALVLRNEEFVWDSLIKHNLTDVAAFFRPSRTASPDLKALYGEELLIVIYLGWAGLLVAGYALWRVRRYRELGPWIWLGLLFFVFSLGPYLNVGGEYAEVGGKKIPLPFLALFEAIPIFDRISHPFRFVMGVQLAVGILASYGMRHLLRKRAFALQTAAVAALGAALLAEIALTSPARLPVPLSDAKIPAVYAEMAEDPAPGAVLDLPLTVPNLERAVYVWYQTVHGRPVPWGLNEPMPEALLHNHLTRTLIRLEAARARVPSPALPELDLVISARALARGGYRYVVVHEDLYPAFKLQNTEMLLTALLGEPARHEADRLLVYTLEIP